MRTGRVIVLAAVAGWLMSVPLAAHHGSAVFDAGKMVTIKGTVKEWIYSNPHCLLKLEVRGDDGKVVEWIAEGQAPNVIFPAGYRKDSFKYGDEVTVTVEPVKGGLPMGRILEVVLANGTKLGRAASAGALPY